jgi:hypothetical protein
MANQTNASLIAKIIQENNMYSLRESPNSLNTCRSNNIDRFQDERKLSVISSSSDLRLRDKRKHSVISSLLQELLLTLACTVKLLGNKVGSLDDEIMLCFLLS